MAVEAPLLAPESPDSLAAAQDENTPGPSPLHRAESSRHHDIPSFSIEVTAESINALLDDTASTDASDSLRDPLILRHSLRFTVERCNVGLASWLAALDGHWAGVLNAEVASLENEEGWGLVGMAVQSSCGRQEMEEIVRIVVGRWGLTAGPRDGRDRGGWTPLHLATLLSTPPLVSFLLTRGAPPNASTHQGLTPLDLIAGMPDRLEITALLEQATATGSSSSMFESRSDLSVARQRMLARRRDQAARREAKLAQNEKARIREQERNQWLRAKLVIVGVDVNSIMADEPRKRMRQSLDSGLGFSDDEGYESSVATEGGEEDPAVDTSDMLVFSLAQLPALLDALITNYPPHCQPAAARTRPANAIFLYARFAAYYCDETWLSELLRGAVERIEETVHENTENLAALAFWTYNTTILLHLLISDAHIHEACDSLDLISTIEELVNAIHVFVIRVAERKIDAVLDAALLDHESLEDFNDVRFEGDWNLFKSLGTAKKPERRAVLPKANGAFSSGAPDEASNISASPGLLGTIREKMESGSPFKTPVRSQTVGALEPGITPKLAGVTASPLMTSGSSECTPSSITDILSGVLVTLQLYEVNPAIVIQAFSQAFFWTACELFNRILTRKKYLCRSKAVQIKMNVTVLEDWARINGLPVKTATKHLEPLSQLLQWLQCCSSIDSFDMLVSTMLSLKAINPMQMRRAVREYRYEVGEGHMADECAQYLAQMQKDWERRRVQMSIREMSGSSGEGQQDRDATIKARKPETQSQMLMESGVKGDEASPIDALFDGSAPISDFRPDAAPECLGELLDSRFMLPFLLPEDYRYLVAAPPVDAAYVHMPRSAVSGTISPAGAHRGEETNSRASSRSSCIPNHTMNWQMPTHAKLRTLPPDFFDWLRKQDLERASSPRWTYPSLSSAALDPVGINPLDPKRPAARPVQIPVPPTISSSAANWANQERAPLPTHLSTGSSGSPFPSTELRSSESIDKLRQSARASGQFTPPASIRESKRERHDSFELGVVRSRPEEHRNGIMSAPIRGGAGFPASASLPNALATKQGGQRAALSPTGSDSGAGKRWWNIGRRDTRRGSSEDTAHDAGGIELSYSPRKAFLQEGGAGGAGAGDGHTGVASFPDTNTANTSSETRRTGSFWGN